MSLKSNWTGIFSLGRFFFRKKNLTSLSVNIPPSESIFPIEWAECGWIEYEKWIGDKEIIIVGNLSAKMFTRT